MKTSGNSTKVLIVALTLATGLFSCKKDTTDDSSVTGSKISLGVSAVNTSAVITTTTGTSFVATAATAAASSLITWTAGTANVSKFEFESTKGGVKKEIEFKGLTNINLFAANPALVVSKIDTGAYKEIELKLVLAKTATGDNALTLKGSFTRANGSVVPVQLEVNDNLTIKVEIKNLIIDSTTDLKTTFLLRLNKIFDGVSSSELENATLNSGTIVISNVANTSIFNKIKANVLTIGGRNVEGEHHGHNGSDDTGSDDHGNH